MIAQSKIQRISAFSTAFRMFSSLFQVLFTLFLSDFIVWSYTTIAILCLVAASSKVCGKKCTNSTSHSSNILHESLS